MNRRLARICLVAALASAALGSMAVYAATSSAPADSADDTEANLTAEQRAATDKANAATANAAQTAIDLSNPKHLPAFPGAEGFGALATGGRGGDIYHVTTLDDSGPGSFRDAVSKPNRIVVFDVGGVIKLAQNVDVSSNITIAGQTAPGDGICIYNRSVSLGGHSNIIIRYLRFREGIAGDKGKKSLGMDKSSDIIVDHCSIQWGRWDDIGITVGSNNVTFQNCIIAEAIDPQSFGALIDSVNNISLSHNLWMSNISRNPKVKGTVQFINNVVYDWGITGLCGGHSAGDHQLDVINNYFIKGPSSNDRFAGEFYATDHVYQDGNYVDLDRDGTLNGKLAVETDFHRADEKTYTLPTFVKTASMHPLLPITTDGAAAAYAKVVAGAGCSLHRDAVDLRLIDELTSLGQKGKTLPHPDPNGEALAVAKQLDNYKNASASPDAAKNGLPDSWMLVHGLDSKDNTVAGKLDSSGYLNIEVYFNSLAVAVTTTK